ncbi:MAG: SWIM zinc finger family protein [Deltaproteobacteria bacterium]|nr:SWIM zinc finger family protein [Deltaproteobacteria bacterium]
MARKRTTSDPFADLTWDDLEAWAGATIVSRGRGYQRGGHVQALARTPNGGLVAWVYGTQKYATKVEVEDGALSALCTCPYGGTCKHAVAVVLIYLDQLKQQQEVPTATASDKRLKRLEALAEEDEWGEDDEDNEDDEDERDEEDQDEEEEEDEYEPAARATPRRSDKKTSDALSPFLEQQSKEQLVALLKEQANRNPDLRQALQDRVNLSTGAVKKLVKDVREEIESLNSEPDWGDDWDEGEGDGSIDYSRLRSRLEALLAAGHADDVVNLGEELLVAGTRHVEMIHDEGETGEQISLCLEIVFRALPQSALSPAQ